jgi:hypothetical protein
MAIAPPALDTEQLPMGTAGDDAASNATLISRIGTRLWTYNGATWDRVRSGLAGFAAEKIAAPLIGAVQTVPIVRYVLNRPVLADTEATNAQANTRGDLAIAEQFAPVAEDNTVGVYWIQPRATASATNAWTRATSAGTAVGTVGIVVKGSAGRLRKLRVVNTLGAVVYAMVHNKAAAPVNTDAPVDMVPLAATVGEYTFDYGETGEYLSAGIGIAFSSTAATLTLLVAANQFYFAQYA